MTIRVTEATPADLPSVEPLWLGMKHHHAEVLGNDIPFLDDAESWARRRAKYEAWFEEPQTFLLLASEADGAAPVGYAFCRVDGPRISSTVDFVSGVGQVESLSVAPASRGAGVGTALLAAARTGFVQRGCTYWSIGVVEGNAGATALYERTGFRPWDHQLIGRLTDTQGRTST